MASKTVTLNVPHMDNDHDADSILRALMSVAGISSATPSLDRNSVELSFDESLSSAADFISALDAEGFEATVET